MNVINTINYLTHLIFAHLGGVYRPMHFMIHHEHYICKNNNGMVWPVNKLQIYDIKQE